MALEIMQDESYLEDSDFNDIKRNDIAEKIKNFDPKFKLPQYHKVKPIEKQRIFGKLYKHKLSDNHMLYKDKVDKYEKNENSNKKYKETRDKDLLKIKNFDPKFKLPNYPQNHEVKKPIEKQKIFGNLYKHKLSDDHMLFKDKVDKDENQENNSSKYSGVRLKCNTYYISPSE